MIVKTAILAAATVVVSSLSIPSPFGVPIHFFLIPLVAILLGPLSGVAVEFLCLVAQFFMYNGRSNPRVKSPPVTVTSNGNYLSESQFKALKQGGANGMSALAYFKTIPQQSLASLIKVPGGNTKNGGSSNGGSQGSGNAQDNGLGNGSGILSSQGSVGSTATVSAASTTSETTAPGDEAQGQKSYEISKTSGNDSSKSSFPVGAAAVGIIIILGLVGLGFLYRGGSFGQ